VNTLRDVHQLPPLHGFRATVGLRVDHDFVAGSPAKGLNAGTTAGTSTTSTNPRGGCRAHRRPSSQHDGPDLQTAAYTSDPRADDGCDHPQNLRQGCLDIFDTTNWQSDVLMHASERMATSWAGPVDGSHVIYVLRVARSHTLYDTMLQHTIKPLNIAGTAFGVVQLSPKRFCSDKV